MAAKAKQPPQNDKENADFYSFWTQTATRGAPIDEQQIRQRMEDSMAPPVAFGGPKEHNVLSTVQEFDFSSLGQWSMKHAPVTETPMDGLVLGQPSPRDAEAYASSSSLEEDAKPHTTTNSDDKQLLEDQGEDACNKGGDDESDGQTVFAEEEGGVLDNESKENQANG